MNSEQPHKISEEALEIQKEIFMTSGGIKIGQSMAEYKAEREALWSKMHSEQEVSGQSEKAGDEIDNSEVEKEGDLPNQAVEAQKSKDDEALKKVRQELGLEQTPNEAEIDDKKFLEKFDELTKQKLDKLRGDKGREGTYKAIQELFTEMRQRNIKSEMCKFILDDIYRQKREADYPMDSQYEDAWKIATEDNSFDHKIENNWVYRGNFTSGGKKTVNRGSLNITVTENTVRDLDSLIKEGIIDANYKFGQPETQAQASDRHDAVTLYFLKEPSPEALKALSEIADKYYRGDNLLGKQVSRGFSISEFGSVSDTHARELVKKIEEIVPEVGGSVRDFLTNKARVAMSEAQFYATKEALGLLGIDIKYSPDKGFEVEKK